MASNVTVYTGPWMNWTKGPIYGGTITLTLRDASILVSFFALFVRLVGSHLWSIFCYLLHQWRSKQGNRDAFHHQHQALLRNSSSAATTLWLWLKVGWAWRSETLHPVLHSLAFVAIGILYIAAIGIAGLFSSRIVITDHSVLVRSNKCGSWPLPDEFTPSNSNNFSVPPDVFQEQESYAINSRQDLTGSLAYVQDCYPVAGPGCENYIVGALNQTITWNASCPFDESLCLTDAIEIITGFIDSAIDLVLSTDSTFATSKVGPDPNDAAYPDDDEMYFWYGPDKQGDNYTMNFSNYTTNGAYDYWYDLSSASSIQDFTPIEAFNPANADIDILFLLNRMEYLNPVDDPWFAAHVSYNERYDTNFEYPPYVADRAVSPLGCTTSHQFCNPNLPPELGCTSWNGWEQTLLSPSTQPQLSFNSRQNATYTRLMEAAYAASLDQVLIALDQGILFAAQYAAKDLTVELPSDWWKEEVVQLNSIMLAYMQSLMVSYVTGPELSAYDIYIKPPSTPEEQEFCENQIIQNTSFYCFSVLGMAVILVVGGLIILINLILEPLVRLFRNMIKRDHGLYKQLEWDMTETLQLQRLVYEGQGSGTWHGEPDVVPVTTHGDRFGIPKWMGVGDAKRISLGGASAFESVDSPLMKGEVRTVVTEA
ncbi:hypothetical protein JMJ35_007313 [Cladonia borealis]|uniref:Uncharacterized protein n=1 Tax=Cladonia borealis TaxID=184061 RepID=A0AA39QX63_9LECA|nr:hypothetical protein JMJ35_007313 [Cladonia borealis]